MRSPTTKAISIVRTGLAAAMLATFAVPLAGQAPLRTDFPSTVSPGDEVRLAAPGLRLDLATVGDMEGDLLTLVSDQQEWRIEVASIQRLEVRRSKAARFAVGGVVLGAGLGALSKFFITRGQCRTNCPPVSYGPYAGVGAVSLGVAGWLVGTRSYRWEPILP